MKNQAIFGSIVLGLFFTNSLYSPPGGRGSSNNPGRNIINRPIKESVNPSSSNNTFTSSPAAKQTTPTAGAVDFSTIQASLSKAQDALKKVTFPSPTDPNIQGFYTNNLSVTLEALRSALEEVSKNANYQKWIAIQANKDILISLVQAAWPKNYCWKTTFIFKTDLRPKWVKQLIP